MARNSKARKRKARRKKRKVSKLKNGSTLVVQTSAGVMLREIPPASALLRRGNHGIAAEDSISEAADTWGLPDFVYESEEIDKGDGRRELGDLFVIVEGLAAVVQVKGRPDPTESTERECKWVSKQVKKAVSQASGTLRTVERMGATLRSRRGPELSIAKSEYEWMKVVVVEHSKPPAEFAEIEFELESDTVVLLRSDWDFLFRELRSTTGVLMYLQRAHGIGLGEHPAHYYRLAQLDEATTPDPPGFDVKEDGWRVEATPQMPLAPAGIDQGRRELLLRAMMEDAAVVGISSSDVSEEMRLITLSSLDRFPLVHRPALCTWINSCMQLMAERSAGHPDSVHFASRNFGTEDLNIPQFIVIACAKPLSPVLSIKFSEQFAARHFMSGQRLNLKDLTDLRTVGLIVSVARDKGPRLWDTTAIVVQGNLGLTSKQQEELIAAYPMKPHDLA